VLHNVIHGNANPEPWQKAMLSFQPAILHGYRRHRVKGADYPGIVPVTELDKESIASNATSSSRTSVLGTLVSGLTDGDIFRLNMYEGPEYKQENVIVRTLGSLQRSGHTDEERLREGLDAASANTADEGEEISAVTYVWTADRDQLEDAEWDFESFKRDKLHWWARLTEDEW
jgi:hypothetical protein